MSDMSDSFCNRNFKALECLYLNSKEMQENDIIQKQKCRDQLSVAKEFCTIKMTTARRTGHSTAIAKFITKHKNNWVIITPVLKQADFLHNMTVNEIKRENLFISKENSLNIESENRKINFMSIHNFDNQLRGLELDGIIVDCASFMNPSKIDLLYRVGIECMRNKPYMFFIFVE